MFDPQRDYTVYKNFYMRPGMPELLTSQTPRLRFPNARTRKLPPTTVYAAIKINLGGDCNAQTRDLDMDQCGRSDRYCNSDRRYITRTGSQFGATRKLQCLFGGSVLWGRVYAHLAEPECGWSDHCRLDKALKQMHELHSRKSCCRSDEPRWFDQEAGKVCTRRCNGHTEESEEVVLHDF